MESYNKRIGKSLQAIRILSSESQALCNTFAANSMLAKLHKKVDKLVVLLKKTITFAAKLIFI
ncbi:hypothetical protein [Segatella baroniae]|uniref:hypothetical protein n=1 Tax=Segatella baroniae TaxID=305719 RepID=UPI00041F4EE7|nr:hypothetical protein [Segatella baroniae]